MFRDSTSSASSAYDNVRPYVNRALQDDDIRRNVLRAFKAAKKVYGELAGEDAVGMASRVAANKGDLRDDLDTTVQSLSEALVRMSGHKPHRRGGWLPFVLLAVVGVILFNPATGATTRKWVKDHLFGSEEEFDYASPLH